MKKSKNIKGPNLRITKINYTPTHKQRFEVTFGEMQNLQLSNCRNVKVKKHIFTVEYSKFNSSILCHNNMVMITFHAVLILTMNCAILTIIFYTSIHG